MRKSLIWALVLMALCVLTLIFTKGHVDIALYKAVIHDVPVAVALLVYTGMGLAIGVLLK